MQGEVMLRTSERGDFRRCPQKWWWAWREGLRSNRPPNNPLWLGSLVHEALAAYYVPGVRRGPHPAETFGKLAADELRHFKKQYPNGDYSEEKYVDGRTLGIAMLEEYVKHWKGDESWKVIRAEEAGQVLVRRNYFLPDERYATYGIKLDAVVLDMADGKLKMIEHKTAASIQTNHLALDSQANTYWAFNTQALRSAGVIKPNQIIDQTVYNFLRKALPDERPVDANGQRCNLPTKQHYVDALDEIGVTSIQAKGKDGAVALEKAPVDDLKVACKFAGLTVLGEPSKKQPLPYFVRHPVFKTRAQVALQINAIEDELEIMDAMRHGDLPVFKSPVAFGPQSCAGCQFREPCELHDVGGDYQELLDWGFKAEDPYIDHREQREVEE